MPQNRTVPPRPKRGVLPLHQALHMAPPPRLSALTLFGGVATAMCGHSQVAVYPQLIDLFPALSFLIRPAFTEGSDPTFTSTGPTSIPRVGTQGFRGGMAIRLDCHAKKFHVHTRPSLFVLFHSGWWNLLPGCFTLQFSAEFAPFCPAGLAGGAANHPCHLDSCGALDCRYPLTAWPGLRGLRAELTSPACLLRAS